VIIVYRCQNSTRFLGTAVSVNDYIANTAVLLLADFSTGL